MKSTNAPTDRYATVASAWPKYTSTTNNNPTSISASTLLSHAHSTRSFSDASTILDVGCGPGTVTSTLIDVYENLLPEGVKVLATDVSPTNVERVQSIKQEKATESSKSAKLWSSVDTHVLDATNLEGIQNGSVSHAVAGFVLFMVSDSNRAMREIARVLQTGGLLALTSWKSNEWMDLCIDVCAEFASEATYAAAEQSLPRSWRTIDSVRQYVERGDLEWVSGEEFECGMSFESSEKVVRFLVGVVPQFREMVSIATEAMKEGSPEERKEVLIGGMIRKLQNTHGHGPGTMRGRAIVAVGRKV